MQFSEFNSLMQKHVAAMLQDSCKLFAVDIDKDVLWNLYLDSFPAGTNEIYRERREFDCSCCRSFVRGFGNVVAIHDGQLLTVWDFETGDATYQPVVDALSVYVKARPISDVFITKESGFGIAKNHEQNEDGSVRTWSHFRVDLPTQFVTKSSKSEASLIAEYRDTKNVFCRSLDEITEDAINTVLELIAQKSLYKGDEWQGALSQFLTLHKAYHALPDNQRDLWCWSKSIEVGAALARIKNHSIGVLLVDISDGVDLDAAVRKYESIVAPTNYKRPKAIFTKRMIEDAQKVLTELGLIDSLGRRHATLNDITVNNILFANRDSARRMAGDVFAELQSEVVAKPKQFDRVEEVSIDRFIADILPTATSIEAYIENRHASDLVSLIAPKVKGSPSLFKWDNGFSWAYSGNIADSMKQRVKAAGGNVDGVLRFSIQWNEEGDNPNDFDAHCIEPNGNEIYFPSKGRTHPSTGILDVDIIHPDRGEVAVENITWSNLSRMQEGVYHFFVRNYNHRGGRSGFRAEIEYGGQTYAYDYGKDFNGNITVAKLKFTHANGIQFVESLPSTTSSKTIWGIQTNQFVPVSVAMFSPNYWDGQSGIGHKHYFFMLNGCINGDCPNGFFNEFLREEFMQHKRVFEALGSKMAVKPTDDQLSGLGFSSTKRNSLVVKVSGSFERAIKLMF